MKLAYEIIEEHYKPSSTKNSGNEIFIEEQVTFVKNLIIRNAKKGQVETKVLSDSIHPSTVHYFESEGFLVTISDNMVEFWLPFTNA